MKYLTVLRHAKSDWGAPSLPDHDRVLDERGLRAAPVVARFLMKTYFGGNGSAALMPAPDRIISSALEDTLPRATGHKPDQPFETGYGMWAKYGLYLSAEEIDANRREMFRNFVQDF